MQNEKDKQEKNIGPFSFDYDDDIESEVLTSEQVYRDLKELDDILGKNDSLKAGASEAMNKGRTRKWYEQYIIVVNWFLIIRWT